MTIALAAITVAATERDFFPVWRTQYVTYTVTTQNSVYTVVTRPAEYSDYPSWSVVICPDGTVLQATHVEVSSPAGFDGFLFYVHNDQRALLRTSRIKAIYVLEN